MKIETNDLCLPSPLQLLSSPLLESKNIKLYVKRDDLIHPIIGGNKWRKLKYNIAALTENKPVLSFGGAFSNHIYALAGMGNMLGVKTIGVIRGEPCEPLNRTLAYAKKSGMQLYYVSREDYRLKEAPAFIEKLKLKFGDFTLLPEGGSNKLALQGCSESMDELNQQLDDYDVVCVPCGTGGTLAGLVSSGVINQTNKKIMGFSVLKGGDFLNENIDKLLSGNDKKNKNWEINLDYHFNGYAKKTPELIDFISAFKKEFNIKLEPVYSGKMFFGLFDLIKKDCFIRGATIVAIHTGGLQNSE